MLTRDAGSTVPTDLHDLHAEALALLSQALEWLAAPARAQVEDLERWRVVARGHESQAGESRRWSDVTTVAPRLVRELVGRIDTAIEGMRDDDRAWTPDALADDPRWTEIRALARRALMAMP